MSTTANPHLRAIVLAGALALVAVALGFFTLTRQQPSSDAAPVIVPHRAGTAPTTTTTATTAPTKTTAAAAPKPKPKPLPARPDPIVQAALATGLPKPVANAFAGREVVVVTLYSSSAVVDRTVEAEAEAGAQLGGAGYVAIDAAKEGASGALTKLLGLLTPPVTLVFAQPDFKQYVRLDGFSDRQTVAQAARNADPTPDGAAAAKTPWALQADKACDGFASKMAALNVTTTQDLKAATPQVQQLGQGFLATLGGLKAPAGAEADVARFVELQTQNVALTGQLVAATARKDAVAVSSASGQQSAVSQQVNALALQLGATHCAGAL